MRPPCIAYDSTSTQSIFVIQSDSLHVCPFLLLNLALFSFALADKYDPNALPNAETQNDVTILVRSGYRSSNLLYRFSKESEGGGGGIVMLFRGVFPPLSPSGLSSLLVLLLLLTLLSMLKLFFVHELWRRCALLSTSPAAIEGRRNTRLSSITF